MIKFKHRVRDFLIKFREDFYEKIIKKPRIYYINKPSFNAFRKIKKININEENNNLEIFLKIRKNNVDQILLLKTFLHNLRKRN